MKIVIDAGHGYTTPGKRCPDDSMREWEFNHVVAAYVVEELATFVGVETLITHDPTPNRDVPLAERTNKANAWGANVFVSIHANAMGSTWGTAKGIETFTYTTKPAESVKLANQVQAELIKATGLYNRGVKADNFHVLRESNMTAILCECGFMDNPNEAALLKNDDYRRKVAGAIVKGLAIVYGLQRKPKPIPVSTPEPVAAPVQAADPYAYQGDMMKKAIESLGARGFLQDINGWKAKVDNGKINDELAFLTLVLLERITK